MMGPWGWHGWGMGMWGMGMWGMGALWLLAIGGIVLLIVLLVRETGCLALERAYAARHPLADRVEPSSHRSPMEPLDVRPCFGLVPRGLRHDSNGRPVGVMLVSPSGATRRAGHMR